MNHLNNYISSLQELYKTGDAKEHSYRSAFQTLIEALSPEIIAVNEPTYTGGNAPDYLFKKGDTPIAYGECKDIVVDIQHKDVQKQALRYVDAFGRILLTNYIDFEIIDESGSIQKLSIAKIQGNTVVALEDGFEQLVNVIIDYLQPSSQTIRSARKLASIMASKGRILRDSARASLTENTDSDIFHQYEIFKKVLINDLSEDDFADMYAQTIVYGLFVARYHDTSLENFSRYEAQDLLPSTNPLLKKFFGHVAGTEYDPKISWIVDSLIETYLSTDVSGLMHKEFIKKQKDPVLHFYETFLGEYDQSLRKSRGVYYTPEPVVSFIVRSVDQILKDKFNLTDGLASTEKISHEVKVAQTDGRTTDGLKKLTQEIHKVQILDPAVGTGTFLNEVIHEIHRSFKGQEGLWNGYAQEHLLPRLHGFELMMASYTMAHLKLGITLNELGYKGSDRLSVWLTNSLEESVHEIPSLFMSQWLTDESNQASKIKSETPVMVVVGNPPYSISSSNKSPFIENLVSEYKKDLGERNIQPLSDDYIKFIRLAEHQIEQSGSGVVGMITNNSYLDGLLHWRMREHLITTFDEIYVMNLNGDLRKKIDGDENVFDIQQGVSVVFFIKNSKLKKDGKVFYSELVGKRRSKYDQLNSVDFGDIYWEELRKDEKNYFVPKNFDLIKSYEEGFTIDKIFLEKTSGVKTHDDKNLVSIDSFNTEYNQTYAYRPMDNRFINYDRSKIGRDRFNMIKHFIDRNNTGLIFKRRSHSNLLFLTKDIMDLNYLSAQTYVAPLYTYTDSNEKKINLSHEILGRVNEVSGETKPEDILDYIYAVLHSPAYRERYKEFLKIDFPRVPYPKDKDMFWNLVEKGTQLRQLHLMESVSRSNLITTYPESGDNRVEKGYPKFEEKVVSTSDISMDDRVNVTHSLGRVYINADQYFDDVPKISWEFYIGGYQPVQKWLKDRRERVLSTEDIIHYQKVIAVLSRTDQIMKEIDTVFEA